HSGECRYGVCMVGGRHRNGVDAVRFLVEHLAKVFVVLRLRKILTRLGCLPVVYIAEEDDSRIRAFSKAGQVAFSFPTNADAGDIERVAGCDKTVSAEYKARHNRKRRCCKAGVADKVPTRQPGR